VKGNRQKRTWEPERRYYEANPSADPIDWETDDEVVTQSFSTKEEGLHGIHTSAPEAFWGFGLHETIRSTYCC
jgi:hypothetical protein